MISRIDRAVADNIRDIERSFGSQAGLVQDFIVFISRQLKTDLFGYTRFTLQQFCQHTGRNRQDLAIIHPDFISGSKKPPLIRGYAFQTVLDYALYAMLERNIIFSNTYEVKGNGHVIQMHNFPILKDLKLNFDRRSKEQKVYDIRLSDELLYGFLSRYYTLNTETYRRIGKGRGGDSRKKLLLYLSKLSHVLQTTGAGHETLVPLDRLCAFADIRDSKPSHRKQNLERMLQHIAVTGQFPLTFEFTGRSLYHVRLIFQPAHTMAVLQREHNFYLRLLSGLKTIFDSKKDKGLLLTDHDPFQLWLSAGAIDTRLKAQALTQAYYIAFSKNISPAYAQALVLSGEFLKPLLDVG